MKTTKKSRPMIFPMELDDGIFIAGDTRSKEIRIRFDGGGFIHEGLFRHIVRTAERSGKDEVIHKGPVRITSRIEADGIAVTVTISLDRNQGTVHKHLSSDVVAEIMERMDAARREMHSYGLSDDAGKEVRLAS